MANELEPVTVRGVSVEIVRTEEKLSWLRQFVGALIFQAWEPEERVVYLLVIRDAAGEETGVVRVRSERRARQMRTRLLERVAGMSDEQINECHLRRRWESVL